MVWLKKLVRRNRHGHRADPLVDRHRTVGASPVTIGRFTYGDENLTIRQWGEGAALRIGSFCSLADGISIILGGNHQVRWISTYPFGRLHKDQFWQEGLPHQANSKGDVVIGHDVWIGTGVTIMSGVTIGNGAVIGAMAVVSRDVAPFTIVAGNPATASSKRFSEEIVDALQVLEWWTLPVASIREIAPLLLAAPRIEELRGLISRFRQT